MAPAVLVLQQTLQECPGGCHLAPKPASRTRPRRIRPSTMPTLPPYPCGASANRKAKRFDLWVGQVSQRATAGRASGEQPRFTPHCFQLLTTEIPGWREGRMIKAIYNSAFEGDDNGGHRVWDLVEELTI